MTFSVVMCVFDGWCFSCTPLSLTLVLDPLPFVSAADDQQALIWDIQQMPQPIEVPILAYSAQGEINQVQWSTNQSDWIAICFRDNVEMLRV